MFWGRALHLCSLMPGCMRVSWPAAGWRLWLRRGALPEGLLKVMHGRQ